MEEKERRKTWIRRTEQRFSPAPFPRQNGQMASLMEEKAFEDFPMDISEVESGEDDADIPF